MLFRSLTSSALFRPNCRKITVWRFTIADKILSRTFAKRGSPKVFVVKYMLTRTRIGLIIQAALTHPDMTQALGHNVPRVFMLVFGGGCALAGLAGAIGGNAFVTEPNMAASVGAIIFVVVVVGGMGSLAGAFVASLLIGVGQTLAVGLDWSVSGAATMLGMSVTPDSFGYPLLKLKVSQVAPILPYLLLILMLIFRPKGLLGTRED